MYTFLGWHYCTWPCRDSIEQAREDYEYVRDSGKAIVHDLERTTEA
jgi:hypothetical protein